MMQRLANTDIHTQSRLLLHFCAGQALSIMNTFTLGTGSDIRLSSTCLFSESVREKRSRALDWSPCKLRVASSSPMQMIGQKTQNRIPWELLPDEVVRRNVEQRFCQLPSNKAYLQTDSYTDNRNIWSEAHRTEEDSLLNSYPEQSGLPSLTRSTNSSKHEIRQRNSWLKSRQLLATIFDID